MKEKIFNLLKASRDKISPSKQLTDKWVSKQADEFVKENKEKLTDDISDEDLKTLLAPMDKVLESAQFAINNFMSENSNKKPRTRNRKQESSTVIGNEGDDHSAGNNAAGEDSPEKEMLKEMYKFYQESRAKKIQTEARDKIISEICPKDTDKNVKTKMVKYIDSLHIDLTKDSDDIKETLKELVSDIESKNIKNGDVSPIKPKGTAPDMTKLWGDVVTVGEKKKETE